VAVKGSKFTVMRVIPHSPRATLVRYGLGAFLFALAVPAAYFIGAYQVRESQVASDGNRAKEHQQAIATFTQQITALQTTAEVDRQTIEDLRQQVMNQRAQLAASERDLRVYKDLLSPGAKTNPQGISFGVFAVTPLPEPGHFKYSLTVQKLSAKEGDFAGNLEFRVVGQQGDKTLQLSLYQVSAQVTAPSIPLNFKYFQTLDGDMALPQDFVPQTVELVVKTNDRKPQPLVETQLEWPVVSRK
jgi:hypothetical protein